MMFLQFAIWGSWFVILGVLFFRDSKEPLAVSR